MLNSIRQTVRATIAGALPSNCPVRLWVGPATPRCRCMCLCLRSEARRSAVRVPRTCSKQAAVLPGSAAAPAAVASTASTHCSLRKTALHADLAGLSLAGSTAATCSRGFPNAAGAHSACGLFSASSVRTAAISSSRAVSRLRIRGPGSVDSGVGGMLNRAAGMQQRGVLRQCAPFDWLSPADPSASFSSAADEPLIKSSCNSRSCSANAARQAAGQSGRLVLHRGGRMRTWSPFRISSLISGSAADQILAGCANERVPAARSAANQVAGSGGRGDVSVTGPASKPRAAEHVLYRCSRSAVFTPG